MVRDLNFDVEIIPVPIVREKDGLAMSSRNAYLSPAEREDALALSLALRAAREKHRAGACCAEEIVFAATRVLNRMKGIAIEYVEAVDAETLARSSVARSSDSNRDCGARRQNAADRQRRAPAVSAPGGRSVRRGNLIECGTHRGFRTSLGRGDPCTQ